MGCTHFHGAGEFAFIKIDGDDLFGTGKPGPHHTAQPDAAKTDNGDLVTGTDTGGIHDRTDAGHHGPAEDGRRFQ